MSVPSLSLSDFQSLFFTQYSAVAETPANTNEGSTVWALGNAVALLALNVQQELAYVQQLARLGTSVSSDPDTNSPNVDTFVEPFGVSRIEATYASGAVTLTAPSPATAQILIPVGGLVATDAGLTFAVIPDTTNNAYNATLGGYVMPVGSTSVNVSVQCSIAGSIGDVQPGQISSLANTVNSPPITGIATVNNASAFTNGEGEESDTSLQARFQAQMSTGNVGTPNALVAAALAVAPGTANGAPGLTYSEGDGLNSSGTATSSVVSMYVNYAGTGTAPPGALVSQVTAAIRAKAAAGIVATAYAPTVIPVNSIATIHMPTNVNSIQVLTACQQAYASFINNLGLNPTGGSTEVDYFSVASILRAVPSVTKIDGLLIGENTITPIAGVSTATSAGSLTDSTRSWTTNAYAGCTVTSGGSFAVITSNTGTVLTISSWTGTTPTAGSNYTITSTPAGTSDLTAAFGSQFVAGAVSFVAAQP